MCKYKTLAHNENGYVVLCNNCRHYQLAFGTTAVSFSPGDLAAFKQELSRHMEEGTCRMQEERKGISVNICRCSMMVLNYRELCRLTELLSLAAFTEEMENIFENIKLSRE